MLFGFCNSDLYRLPQGHVGPGTEVLSCEHSWDRLSKWGKLLLDTQLYEGVSVLRCVAECCDVINCRLDAFLSVCQGGVGSIPPPFLDTRIIF